MYAKCGMSWKDSGGCKGEGVMVWHSRNGVVKVELSDVGRDSCPPSAKVLVNWDINMKMNYLHGVCKAIVH